ncbi:hypothetical protein ES703_44130 [subsurface metagenome]
MGVLKDKLKELKDKMKRARELDLESVKRAERAMKAASDLKKSLKE